MKNGQKYGKFHQVLEWKLKVFCKTFLNVSHFQFKWYFVLFHFILDQNISAHTNFAVTYIRLSYKVLPDYSSRVSMGKQKKSL
jgi:hypothetical protein